MATLANIQKEIARLEKQAAAIRKTEAAAAAATARALIARHHLSAADVGLATKPAKAAEKAPTAQRRKLALARPGGVAKYRDPESGKTWTGTGKPPGWIAGTKNRDKFLINAAAAAPAQPAAKAAAKTATKPAAKPSATTQAKPAASGRATRKAAAPQAVDAVVTPKPASKTGARKAAVKKSVVGATLAEQAAAEVVVPAEAAGN